MKLFLTTALWAVFLALTSCQKEISTELSRQTTPSDTLLSRILVYDTISPGINMTLVEFLYDNQDRVTEIKDTYFDSANGNLDIHEQASTFFYYTGAESKPFKSVGWTRYVFQEYEVYHFYDSNGRIILDSLGAPDQSYLLGRYAWSPDKLAITSSYYDENGALTDQLSDSFYISNANITNAYLSFPLTQQNETAFEYTYDNSINPLSKLNIASCIGFDTYTPMDKFWMLPFGESRNNIVRRLGYTDPPGVPYVREYRFNYNDNNMPVSGTFLVDGKDDEGIRILYEYTE